MEVTHSGPVGLGVPCHVDRELSVALVHAPILPQQTVDETAVDWDKLQNCKDATHVTAQVNIFLTIILDNQTFDATAHEERKTLDLWLSKGDSDALI